MLSNMKEGKSGYGLDPKRKEVSLYYYMPLKIEESGEPWYVVTAVEDSVLQAVCRWSWMRSTV